MNKVLLFIVFYFLIGMSFSVSKSFAYDLGIHTNISSGSGSAEFYDDRRDYDSEDQSDSNWGLGLLINGYIDNDGRDILVNRFMIMYEAGEMDVDFIGPDREYDLSRLSIYDTLGIIFFLSSINQIWIGPQFGIRTFIATDEYADYYGVGGSIGAALGTDFFISDYVSLGIEIGVRYSASTMQSTDYYNTGADIRNTEGFFGVSLAGRIKLD